jgi:hypothetical protein
MNKLFSRKNIYCISTVIAVLIMIIWAFSKTDYKWTSKTAEYLFFNAFWAVVVVLIDKFFHEQLQSEYNELKTKLDKVKGLIVTDEKMIKIENIRLVLNGKDDEISAIKANSIMDKKISETDSVKKPGRVKLSLE